MNKEFLNTREAANMLGISEYAVRDLCRRNLLEGAVKDPRNFSWRIPATSVDNWKNQNPSKPISQSGGKTRNLKIATEHKWLTFYASIFVGVLGLIGILGAARIQSKATIEAARMQVEVPIHLTQTAEVSTLPSATNSPQTIPGSGDRLIHPLPTPSNQLSAGHNFSYHVVQPGETLNRIATHYGVSTDSIVYANGGYGENFLLVGDELVIPSIIIGDVKDRGSLQDEALVLLNPTFEPISLRNWSLSDNRGHTYYFGNVELFGEGAGILLYTKEGNDMPSELFWGLDESLWESGSIATLRDHNLNVRSQFIIP